MKRLLLAISSGLLLALGWPTYGFPFLLFFAFVPLLWLERDIRQSQIKWKRSTLFGYSYISFFIWNAITTSWLWYADPFGASFAVLVNSLLMGCLVLLYHSIAKRANSSKALLFLVALWLSFEKLHLGWEFSWPWLNLGNAFSEFPALIQWYEYTGTFGGSLWVWIGNVIVFKGVLRYFEAPSKSTIKSYSLKFGLLLSIPIAISSLIYFTYKASEDTISVIAIQPNIDPYSEKYNTTNSEIADLLIDLSQPYISRDTDFIIAPETVFANNVRLHQFEYSPFKTKLDRFINQYPNTNILTGVSFIETFNDPYRVRSETNLHPKGFWYDDYNSAVLINNTDSIQKYDKSKLVVGVENFPYQWLLKPLIGDTMIDLGGTVAMKTTQDYRSVFTGSNSKDKAAPIICYESVYGEFVTEYVRNGANFLAIITNDAWWNETQGHKQHLSYAKLRAIESRRSIVRSANTGISALIDERGIITESLGYNKQGAVSGEITTNTKQTFYVVAGDYIARIAIFVAAFIFLIVRFRKKRI